MHPPATTVPDRRRADWPLIIGLAVSLVAHLALGVVFAHRDRLFPQRTDAVTLAAVQPIRPPQERVPLGGDRPQTVTISWIGAEELIEAASPDPSEVDQAQQEPDPSQNPGLTPSSAPVGEPVPEQPLVADRVIEGDRPTPGAEPTPPAPQVAEESVHQPITTAEALAIAASTPSPATEAQEPADAPDAQDPPDPTTETDPTETPTDTLAETEQPAETAREDPGERAEPTDVIASLADTGDVAAERATERPPQGGEQAPQSAASPASAPQTPSASTATTQPTATPPAAAPPSGQPATEPAPTQTTPSDRETPFAARRQAPRVTPGQPVEAQGLRIRTTRPRHSSTTYATGRHRGQPLVVRISFGADGRAKRVDLLRSTGDAFVDQDYVRVIYNDWRATGAVLDELTKSDPRRVIPVDLRILR